MTHLRQARRVSDNMPVLDLEAVFNNSNRHLEKTHYQSLLASWTIEELNEK